MIFFMEYHPSKKHIKASIIPNEELQNIPDNITIPFFLLLQPLPVLRVYQTMLFRLTPFFVLQ